ncbi:S41 family peptidase [Alloyangia pacifica]|uniref:Tricorn protease homolog n=1 Tax=Alloyangia pacifica TaxID=311180 RepID=A0A1I6RFC2_9RHOB|nr:S41 family peptidase [Alloyangia pacifica]SDG48936.1 tricorn protease [Alloyangia pacifica]SFS63429.1 tricorn protease [Alloyangia pacifica]
MKTIVRCLVGLLAALSLTAPAVSAEEQAPFWVRGAQISPDGSTIAFTYRGQIWIVPSEGGEAVPLTERQFRSTSPVWSPDSSRIAFASDRFNLADVFVMPVAGGEITRLTRHSGAEHPLAFSADGAEVLFSADRLGTPTADHLTGLGLIAGVVMRVSVTGGRPRLVMPLPSGQLDVSPDGRTLAYVDRTSPEVPWRKREISDGTSDIWLYDIQAGTHRRFTRYRGSDRSPAFSADGSELFWATEMPEAGIGDPDAAPETFNIWRMPLAGEGAPTRVTSHDRLPVRFVSAADDGTLAYTYDTQIWRLDPGAAAPVQVPLRIRQGTLLKGEVYGDLGDQITETSVSPDGSELAVVARGDIFVLSPLSGEVRRITDTPQAERSVSYGPDGRRLLYAAEREGDWDIYQTALTREEDENFLSALALEEVQLIDTGTDALQPAYAPDGIRIAYRDDRNAIRIWDSRTGESSEILPDSATYFYGEAEFDFAWSPDGRYILTTTGFGSANTEVELIETTGAHLRHNLSDSGFGDHGAGFSPDGSVVFWATDRFSERNLDENGGTQDVMAAYLTPEGYLQRELGEAAPIPPTGAEPSSEGKEEAAPPLEPDFEGLPYRRSRITGASVVPVLAEMTPDNAGMVLVTFQPTIGVLTGSVIDMASRHPRQVFATSPAGIVDIAISPDRGTLYLMHADGVEIVDVASGASAPVPFSLQASYDPVAEMEYLFEHHWRFVQSKFYDAGMHGVDWPGVRDIYARYLPHLSHWEDFAELMAEMLGELNASHLNTRFASDSPSWDSTAELGLYYDTLHEGPGVRIAATLPGGPAALLGPSLAEGAVILAVDGEEIGPEADITPLLNRRAGDLLRLTVQPADGGAARDMTLRAAPPGTEPELAYAHWVTTRRAMVEELSGGRLGYTHVRSMDDASFRQVYSDLMGKARDKEGAIVDQRFNFGGFLHDQLTAFLTGSRHSGLVTRNGVDLGTTPYTRWAKPTALVVNSWDYSDASVFPYYYIHEGLGPSVGDMVPGTGTAVLRPPLLEPRLVLGVPQLGFRTVEGDFFENREIVPEEIVRVTPEDIEAGRDPQLAAAVAALLRDIDD